MATIAYRACKLTPTKDHLKATFKGVDDRTTLTTTIEMPIRNGSELSSVTVFEPLQIGGYGCSAPSVTVF